MDRVLIYPGQIPLETDLLNTNRNTMLAISKLAKAMFGTNTIVNGLSVGASSPAALTVDVQPGEIYSLQNLDSSSYSSLPADTAHQVMKQGIMLDKVTLACAAPGTSGFSINYLIQATLQESDGTPVVLPFYNASNPSQAYSGPNNTGASSNTVRACTAVVTAKAGTAATTGTQTTPAPDSGYVGIAVVTVANGQSTIVAGNISAYSGAPVQQAPLTTGRLLNVQVFTSSGTYTPTAGTTSVLVEGCGGGGAGGSTGAAGASTCAAAGGGASANYFKTRMTSGFSGVTVTIGAGGAPSAAGANNGGNGGTTSFGAFAAGGGVGGTGNVAFTPPLMGGNGGQNSGFTPVGNMVSFAGQTGGNGMAFSASVPQAGAGGSSPLGAGGCSLSIGAVKAASGYGSGGCGAISLPSAAAAAGNAGMPGVVIVYEYA